MSFGFAKVMAAIVLLVGCAFAATAQSYYHQLSVDEFEGKPGGIPGMVAYTNCSIDFRYRVTNDKRNNFSVAFDVQLIFNRDKSWIDKRRVSSAAMMADIIKHEQGHYIIAYMEQQELIRTVGKTRFGANYQAQATAIFDRIDAKYKQLTNNYDTDTRHSLDREQQHSWDEYFKQRLMYIPPATI